MKKWLLALLCLPSTVHATGIDLRTPVTVLLRTTNTWTAAQTFSTITVTGSGLSINGISYTWPSSQFNGCLSDDGNGNLSWQTCGSGGGGGGGGTALFVQNQTLSLSTFTVLGAKFASGGGFSTITVLFDGVISASHTGTNFWTSTGGLASIFSSFNSTQDVRIRELQVFVSTGQTFDFSISTTYVRQTDWNLAKSTTISAAEWNTAKSTTVNQSEWNTAKSTTVSQADWNVGKSTNDTDHANFKVALATAQTFDYSLSTGFSTNDLSVSSFTVRTGTVIINGVVYRFSPVNPTNGQVLKSDGGNNLAWAADNTGAGGGSDNLGSHVATMPVIMPYYFRASSGVVDSSFTARTIITSTGGFLVGASTMQGVFMLEGGSIAMRNGSNEFTVTFATGGYSVGDRLIVSQVDGKRFTIASGKPVIDTQGGSGTSDNMGSHVSTMVVNIPYGIQGSSGVFNSSLTVKGLIVSATGYMVGPSTVAGTFMLEGGSVQVRNGTNEFTVNFATSMGSVGDRLIITQVTGSRYMIGSGKAITDTQGAGGGGGSSSLAVATGSLVAMGNFISSPTAVINLSSGMFSASLRGGATAFISIGTNTPSLTGIGQFLRIGQSTGIAIWDTSQPRELTWSGSALVAVSTLNSPNVAPIVKSTSSRNEILGASYDDTLEECRGGNFIVPEYVNSFATPTLQAVWFPSSKSGATGNVIWDFRYSTGITDGNSWDVAYTTVTAGASAGYAGANRMSSIRWSPPGSPGFQGRGTVSNMGWAPLSYVNFLVCREGGNSSDTMTGDAVLQSFMLSVPMR